VYKKLFIAASFVLQKTSNLGNQYASWQVA